MFQQVGFRAVNGRPLKTPCATQTRKNHQKLTFPSPNTTRRPSRSVNRISERRPRAMSERDDLSAVRVRQNRSTTVVRLSF